MRRNYSQVFFEDSFLSTFLSSIFFSFGTALENSLEKLSGVPRCRTQDGWVRSRNAASNAQILFVLGDGDEVTLPSNDTEAA